MDFAQAKLVARISRFARGMRYAVAREWVRSKSPGSPKNLRFERMGARLMEQRLALLDKVATARQRMTALQFIRVRMRDSLVATSVTASADDQATALRLLEEGIDMADQEIEAYMSIIPPPDEGAH